MASDDIIRNGKIGLSSIFEAYEYQAVSGASAFLERINLRTDLPQDYLEFMTHPTLKMGYLETVFIRLDWTAVENLDNLWILQESHNDDIFSASSILFELTDHEVGGLADDQEFVISNLHKEFVLDDIGRFYIMKTYSGACGNIKGIIRVSGEVIH